MVVIAVGIPVYNEEKTIGSIIKRTAPYVDLVIVGDDGSIDNTAKIVEKHDVVVVRHSSNLGYGAILSSIFRKAVDLGVDVLVTIDGDGQHNPADIRRLVEPIENGDADLSIGSRYLDQTTQGQVPFLRSCAIQTVTWIVNNTSNLHISDSQSGYRAYNQKALGALNLTEQKMGASLEILYRASELNLRVTEVSTAIEYHHGGQSYSIFSQGIELFSSILRYIPSKPPKRDVNTGFNPFLLSFLIWVSRIVES